MRLIAITPELTATDEGAFICEILNAGFEYVHVRKPSFSIEDMRSYLNGIPKEYHRRLKLHSHFKLAAEFSLGGIHLNHRSPSIPNGMDAAQLSVSRSCHSIAELECAADFDYVFLSPIFDSISKAGYCSQFSLGALHEFFSRNRQCGNVVALGGVLPEYLYKIKLTGFAGAAFLGYLFNAGNIRELNQLLTKIKSNY